MNIDEKVGDKRFTVYDSEADTVLELINELGSLTNDICDSLDNKTDLFGDHKGSWQGLNRPTMSEEGMRATVEDIIDNKIPSIETSLDTKASKIFITFDEFGCIGDGVTDDTISLQKAIEYAENNNVKITSLPNKEYLISSTLLITDKCFIDFNYSKLITTKYINMLEANHEFSKEEEIDGGQLTNIVIDMNMVAKVGILLTNCRQRKISNITFLNVSNTAYKMDKGYENYMDNVHIYGVGTNSVGLELNKGDCHYSNIFGRDVHTAIKCNSTNFFDKIHFWIYKEEVFPNSTFLISNSTSTIYLTNCYSDTYQTGIEVKQHGRIKMVGQYNYFNKNVITIDMINKYGKVYMFKYDTIDMSKNTTISNSFIHGVYGCNNALFSNFDNEDLLLFCDAETRINYWYKDFKFNRVLISNIEGVQFQLITNKVNAIDLLGNNAYLSLCIQNIGGYIETGADYKLLSLPADYRPTKETVVTIPYSRSTAYKIEGTLFCWLSAGGDLYISIPDGFNSNNVIFVNIPYLINRQS